ncbi:MAG: Mur ligase family protein, partial [Nocardioides sp.]
MVTVGVTGTNGKTSIVSFAEQLLSTVAGRRVASIGTEGARLGGRPYPWQGDTPTTPQADQLQPLLESMRRKDAEVLLIEASSLALEQHRVDA